MTTHYETQIVVMHRYS